MFLAHLPAGYLATRTLVTMDAAKSCSRAKIMAAGLIGSVAPDFDMLYFYLVDHRQHHHHSFFTHLPLFWLVCLGLAALVTRQAHKPQYVWITFAFSLNVFLHLTLDSIVGDVWWLAPFVDRPFSMFTVPARFHPWQLNFLLHWSFALELAIIGTSIFVYRRNRTAHPTPATPSAHHEHTLAKHDGLYRNLREHLMPFTPFHLGPGLAIKGLMPNQFSLSIFALSNVAMDVEPLYRMWRVQPPMHGVSHTLAGALLIGIAAAVVGRGAITLAGRLAARWGGEASLSLRITWLQAWLGALLGTGSHLLLDAVMHDDMRPFAPLTDANPLLMTAWMLHLHLACILAAMFGTVLLLARAAWQTQST